MMMTTKTKIIFIFLIAIFVAVGSNIILFRRVAIISSDSESSSERIPQQQQNQNQKQQNQNQELILPLQPPYYIVQHGSVRSGSTFQSQLLMAIIELKSRQQQQQHDVVLKPNYYMNSLDPDYRIKTNKEKTKGSPNSENYIGTKYFQTAIRNGFVVKTHKLSWVQKLLTTFTNMTTMTMTTIDINDDHEHDNEQFQQHQQQHKSRHRRRQVAIFVSREAEDDDDISSSKNTTNTTTSENKDSSSYSSSTSNNIVLIQTYKDLLNCSLCTIDLYQPIFDLSADDIIFLKNYMSKYEILRRCCGYQMSKYERLRLHGCNVTQYQQQNQTHHYDYPWCENYNLTKIELDFTYNSQNIKYHSGELERKINWNQPGDCVYYRNEIQYNNKDFNGRPWNKNIYGCDMNIIDSSKSQNKIRKTKRKEQNIFEKEQRELDRDSAREQRELDRGTKLEILKKKTFQKNQQRQHQQQQLLLLQQQQQ